MSARILFAGFQNLAFEDRPDVVITATSAATNAPATNLRNTKLYLPWVSVGVAEAAITCHYGGKLERLSHLGLFQHNFGPDAEIRADLYLETTPTAAATPVAGVDWVPAWSPYLSTGPDGALPWGEWLWGNRAPLEVQQSIPRHFLHPFLDGGKPFTVAHRSVVLRVRGPNPVGWWQASYLDLSLAYQPEHQVGWDREFGHTRDDDGRLLRTHGFSLRHLRQTEILHRLWNWQHVYGASRPLVVIPEPDRPELWWAEAGLYRLNADRPFSLEPAQLPGRRWNLQQRLDLLEWT